MLHLFATLLASHAPAAGLHQLVLAAPELARLGLPGQSIAIALAGPGSSDPLLRAALPLACLDPTAGTVTLLWTPTAALRPLTERAVGTSLDVLGPIGHGWPIAPATRNLLLIGVADAAAPLLALTEAALRQRLAVTLVLGAPIGPGLPTSLVPPAAEYTLGRGLDPAAAALAAVDDALLRWADAIYLALPRTAWPVVANRLRHVRVRWDRGLAHAHSDIALPCAVGVCGACALATKKGLRLACVDGPVFDLRDVSDG